MQFYTHKFYHFHNFLGQAYTNHKQNIEKISYGWQDQGARKNHHLVYPLSYFRLRVHCILLQACIPKACILQHRHTQATTVQAVLHQPRREPINWSTWETYLAMMLCFLGFMVWVRVPSSAGSFLWFHVVRRMLVCVCCAVCVFVCVCAEVYVCAYVCVCVHE